MYMITFSDKVWEIIRCTVGFLDLLVLLKQASFVIRIYGLGLGVGGEGQ